MKRDHLSTNSRRLLHFVASSDPILRQKCRELSTSEIRSATTQKLIDDLFYTVEHSSRGVGLSANQVGKSEAISVVAIKPTPARPNLTPFCKVFINTKVIKRMASKSQCGKAVLVRQ